MASSYSSLSPERQRLLREIQRINFGRLENLIIREGEPVFEPRPRVVQEIKFKLGAENGPRRELGLHDFALKQEVVELFSYFDRIRNGVIDVLIVQQGLPSRMSFAETAA